MGLLPPDSLQPLTRVQSSSKCKCISGAVDVCANLASCRFPLRHRSIFLLSVGLRQLLAKPIASTGNASADICLFGVELFHFQPSQLSALVVVFVSAPRDHFRPPRNAGRSAFVWACVRIPVESRRIWPLTAASLQLHAPWRAAASGDISASLKLWIGSPACRQSGQSPPD